MTFRRAAIEAIFHRAVESVGPKVAIERAVSTAHDDKVLIDGREYDVPPQGIYVIGLGKASVGMAVALLDRLPGLIRSGLVVTKFASVETIGPIEVVEGSHPVPDERSLEAGKRLLRVADGIPRGALVICLISGGGSALAEQLRPGIDLQQFAEITNNLLRAGADIYDLNAVRSRLSEIKGGGLLARLDGTTIVNLIISDVLGDDPNVIASGPTVPPSTARDAAVIARRYGLSIELPGAALDTHILQEPHTVILANLQHALAAAAEEASELGYRPFVLSSRLDGEARHVARTLATVALDARAGRSDIAPPVCLLAGGETTVHVTGSGRGGRNTEGALAAAIRLAGSDGISMGYLATDGDDGESGAAGGIVDGATIPTGKMIDARKALDDNDSFTFLDEVGAAFASGPTGTNVNDVVIGLIDARDE